MIMSVVIPMIVREIEDQEIRTTGSWDNRDLPVISEKDFVNIDPLQNIPIDGVDCFVRFYGEQGTVLIKSNLYDVRFHDCEKVIFLDTVKKIRFKSMFKNRFVLGLQKG